VTANARLAPARAPDLRAAAAAGAFLGTVCVMVLLSRQVAPPVIAYVGILAGGSALVSLLLWRPVALSARMVMLVAIAAHAIALFGHTASEDDYYRFLWDGWRVLEAGTPYGVPPAQFIDDPAIPPAWQAVLEWVNYPELPTIYGPALQGLFAGLAATAGPDPIGLRIAFAAAALGLTALVLRRHDPGRAALFAWNPLVVAESTLHLHPDILMALALFAGLVAGRRHPIAAGAFLGLAAGIKIVALAAWPLLLRLRPRALAAALAMLGALYLPFAVQGQGIGFETTRTFATDWYFNPLAFEPLLWLLGPGIGRLAALLLAGLLVLRLHAGARDTDSVPLAAIFGAILLFAPAVNAWYLLWLLPFALDRREVWPYAASAALPLSYLTGLNLENYELDGFALHPLAQAGEWVVIAGALGFDLWRHRFGGKRAAAAPTSLAMPHVAVVIPAFNEEDSVGATVRGIRAAAPPGLADIIVADNASSDATAAVAAAAGARVVPAPERGYGAACLAGLAALDPAINVVLFMDADLSDVPEDAAALLAPIIAGEADMVIGSRTTGVIEPGAMTPPQRFGNWLAPALVRVIWSVRYTDLGPFRAIRRDALERLAMADRDFGWTIEMQVRAAKLGLRIAERPVRYRKRVGQSKISGTARGVIAAGWKIFYVIAREAFGDFDRGNARPAGAPPPRSRAILAAATSGSRS
jgi:hypothetical protein